MLTNKELKEVDRYNSLTEDEKKKYLDEHGVIILNISEEKDGSALWTMEIKNDYLLALESYKKDGETMEQVIARVLQEHIKNEKK